ncbi:MAG TPA: ABC transporter permease, partial [Rhodanobacteraceae bacterium]|nr:ABC transporter permease [Rhodanobacteraceae bacterium]
MNIWLAEIWRAWRASLRKPGFLLLAAGVLALGIGASVAVFVLIQQTLLKPLPVASPQRLVAVGPLDGGVVSAVSPDMYQALAGMHGVASLGLVEGFSPPVNIAGAGQPQLIPALHADRGFLATLGVHMAAGRNFSAVEDTLHGPPAVILTEAFRQRHFGARRDVIGKELKVEGVAHAIVGVLPSDFELPGVTGDIVLPLGRPQDDGTNYLAIARLADGAAAASVAAEANARLHAVVAAWDNAFWRNRRFGTQGLAANLHADATPALRMFIASALLLLLIAWVNLANLMLVRALSVRHELAVR